MKEDVRNRIAHLFGQGASKTRIAREVGVSARTVGRVLAEIERKRMGAPSDSKPRRGRPSSLTAFDSILAELLARYPKLTAVRAWEELRAKGFSGGYGSVRRRMRQLRSQPSLLPVARFETDPGVQAQMDYAVYDLDLTSEGRRRVNLFGYVLGYSRRQYLRFVPSQDFETTVREHIRAFEHLGGVAAECLYDNMKVVVSGREGSEPIYNTRFLAFATHYGFRPRACQPRRAQTKGKVERQFHFVETNLLNGRTFASLEHLNEVTAWWLTNVADVRVHGETKERPIDRHARELPHLLPLPERRYDVDPVVYRAVGADGFLTWRQNFYSVPWRWIGRMLPVRVGENELVVYSPQLQIAARHELFARTVVGQRKENPEHRPIDDRREQIQTLRERYRELGDPAARFFEGLVASHRYARDQGRRILALLGGYHAEDVAAALERALRYGAFSLASVERILAATAKPKSLLDTFADEGREHLRPLLERERVVPRPTSDYQPLLEEESHDEHNQSTAGADESP